MHIHTHIWIKFPKYKPPLPFLEITHVWKCFWVCSWFYSCWEFNFCLFSDSLLFFPLLFSYFITKPNMLQMQISISTEPVCSSIHYDQQRQTEEFVGNEMYLETVWLCLGSGGHKEEMNYQLEHMKEEKILKVPAWQIEGKDSPVGIWVFCQVSSAWVALAWILDPNWCLLCR